MDRGFGWRGGKCRPWCMFSIGAVGAGGGTVEQLSRVNNGRPRWSRWGFIQFLHYAEIAGSFSQQGRAGTSITARIRLAVRYAS